MRDPDIQFHVSTMVILKTTISPSINLYIYMTVILNSYDEEEAVKIHSL